MKKVVLTLAVLFSVAMVSCGGNKNAANDSDSVIAEEAVVEVTDSTVGDSVVADTVVAVDSAVVAPVK